jgi:hypothetical protein
MKKIIETKWFYFYFKEIHSEDKSSSKRWVDGIWKYNYWSISEDSLKEKLIKLQEYCDEEQCEIKGVMPLSRAASYSYGQSHMEDIRSMQNIALGGWGLGHGWGIGMINGYAIMLQKIEEVSDDEYIRRKNIKLLTQKILRLNENIKDSLNDCSDAKNKLKELENEVENYERERENLAGEAAELTAQIKNKTYELDLNIDIEKKKKLFKTTYLIGSVEYGSEEEAEKARAEKIVKMRGKREDSARNNLYKIEQKIKSGEGLSIKISNAKDYLNLKLNNSHELEAERDKIQAEISALKLPIDDYGLLLPSA